MVLPSIGIIFGCGVSAHPKFTTVPDTVAPWPGVSIVPNGRSDALFAPVTCRVPMSVLNPE